MARKNRRRQPNSPRSKKALLESEAKFRSIIEYSRDGIVLFDEEGKIIEWNHGMESIFRVKREEVLGIYAWDERFQQLDPQKDIRGLFQTLFETGDSPFLNKIVEYEFVMPGGQFQTIQELMFPIKTANGYMCCGFIRDITERRLAELALKESEENYRALFENTGTAKIQYGEDSIIHLANAEAERLLGYKREELEGKKSWTEFITEDEIEKVRQYFQMVSAAPEAAPNRYETKMRDRQGNVKTIIITIRVIPGTRQRVASVLDISDRKKAEEQLEYLSLHDTLTGLYNRTFFEEEMRYRIGLLVKDNLAGVGTLTFYDPQSQAYGALGHMILDGETNKKQDIKSGKLIPAIIEGIEPGQKGRPGEKIGIFQKETGSLGTIDFNNQFGIYGRMIKTVSNPLYPNPIPVAWINQIHEGPATMLTVINGEDIEEFNISVEKVFDDQAEGKGIIVRVTDPRLLVLTGGIIQGMSGSPVIQDGRLVGAITHVFINDPTRGYALSAEYMVEFLKQVHYSEGFIPPFFIMRLKNKAYIL